MIRFTQESCVDICLPRLSQLPLYQQYDQYSNLSASLREELQTASEYIQTPDDLKELVALMRLNGDAVVKKAIDAWEKGDIVVLFHPETSKIPTVLPYVVLGVSSGIKCFIFADKLMSRLNSTNEYINLMAGLEAGYLALKLQKNPTSFINNRNIMLLIAEIYQFMALCPLEVRLYIKGENLTKAMIYVIAFFYKIIDGEKMSADSINFKRLMKDKVDHAVVKQVVDQVRALERTSFIDLLELIKKINPVRYGNLDAVYLQHFIGCCGNYIMFALEHPAYLFLLLTSASYKTKLTSFNLNKLVGTCSRSCITQLTSIV